MAQNIHATAIVLADRGIVITGPSGSGKTQLALSLLCRMNSSGISATLIADDQIFLAVSDGRLVCSAPEAIAGLIEVRGVGPVAIDYRPSGPVDLLVRLVDRQHAERLPDTMSDHLLGCEVPVLVLASDDREAAAMAVLAWLSLPPFRPARQ